ncbi:MAG TPA: efflux RND transporter periplasmic adaptor subunit [Tepidisphaeraceae bacterium]|nr:efflux RND transporter periplasmic adaptor subunit [Tepidisphaeraceae bacterium]
MRRFLRRIFLLLILLALLAAGGAWYLNNRPAPAISLRTAPAQRGDLVSTIDAPGTLEPEEVIDVGAQVAGQIKAFGLDSNSKPIDYGTPVEEGTVLAQIDDSLYAADVAQATAQLKLAQAGVQRAEADLVQLKAKLDQAKRDWDRAQKLGPSDALAQSSYDAYKATYETAQANVVVGEASIGQARSTVSQAEASLQRAQRNLGYCTIKSPVKGVIIDRRVNIGQTVVASLNAPSLFLIAKDLRRMQVWVAVNEADIGSIFPRQPVRFTVDAFPGREFQGTVSKIRLNATMTQNVVTYTVEVITDNSDGTLLPYLTANVHFEVSRRDDVLMVPNAALRWSPPQSLIDPTLQTASPGAPGRSRGGPSTHPTTRPSRGVLWVQQGNYVRPIPVRTGITDGLMTEIQSDQLQEGSVVVLSEQQPGAANPSGTTNPFMPQLFRRRPASQ